MIINKIKRILLGAWKSKTIWFNTIIAGLMQAEAAFSLLQPWLGDTVYGVALFTLTVGNVLLRGVTDKALADK